MTVVPAPASQSAIAAGGTGSALSSLFSFGITQTSSDYVRYQQLMSSTIVAERLQQKYGMLQYVFSGAWDPQKKAWKESITWRNYLLGWLFDIAHVPIWTPPDISSLAAWLQGNIQILPSTQTDIVNISMASSDPAFATRVLLLTHHEANEVLRSQVEVRSKEKAAYLRQRLSQTDVEDYRQTLLALLSVEEKTLMVTETNNEYAAEILSPPTRSTAPISPRPVLSVFVAVIVGMLAGITVVVLFGPDWLRKGWTFLFARLGLNSRARLPQKASVR